MRNKLNFSDGDDLVLNGSKAFISGAGTSDVYAVMVRTDPSTKAGCNILVIFNAEIIFEPTVHSDNKKSIFMCTGKFLAIFTRKQFNIFINFY